MKFFVVQTTAYGPKKIARFESKILAEAFIAYSRNRKIKKYLKITYEDD